MDAASHEVYGMAGDSGTWVDRYGSSITSTTGNVTGSTTATYHITSSNWSGTGYYEIAHAAAGARLAPHPVAPIMVPLDGHWHAPGDPDWLDARETEPHPLRGESLLIRAEVVRSARPPRGSHISGAAWRRRRI